MQNRKSQSEGNEWRDQGFTRPQVLILLPSRNKCFELWNLFNEILGCEQKESEQRFNEEYGPPNSETLDPKKPPDFHDLFRGNTDDFFRIGLRINQKKLKIYSAFYKSDIIIASPIGLKSLMTDNNNSNADYLSSTELAIVDYADALTLQNWQHVEWIFRSLNLIPKELHDCDFSRVKLAHLEGQAAYLRQTLLFSQFNLPELNTFKTKHMLNVSGALISRPKYDSVLLTSINKVRHIFHRFQSVALPNIAQDKMKYFQDVIAPNYLNLSNGAGMLLLVSSEIEVFRVRDLLPIGEFDEISEHTKNSDIVRARARFISGETKILVYSLRAHHFRRMQIRGVRRVIFYSVPQNPIYYKEIISFLGLHSTSAATDSSMNTESIGLFSTWDFMLMERIVGTATVSTLFHSQDSKFEYNL